MDYYVFNDEVYIKAEELIDFASKENNNKIEIKGRVYASPVCCKDCKYWAYDNFNDEGEITDAWCSRPYAGFMSVTLDDFCSRGERKDE